MESRGHHKHGGGGAQGSGGPGGQQGGQGNPGMGKKSNSTSQLSAAGKDREMKICIILIIRN